MELYRENAIMVTMEVMQKTFVKNGRKFGIRFFENDDRSDYRALRDIVRSRGALDWMSHETGNRSRHLADWMFEKGEDDLWLFAVVEEVMGHGLNDSRVHGFVYVYGSDIVEGALEISYAKRPLSPKGLIRPAAALACLRVREIIAKTDKKRAEDLEIVAEIEQDNIPSIVIAEKIGFEKISEFDHDGNAVWKLNWDKLKEVVAS